MEELNKSFISVSDLGKFNACVLDIINKETPIKKKFTRANEANLMTKKRKEAMMIRSTLSNTSLRHPTNEKKEIWETKKREKKLH